MKKLLTFLFAFLFVIIAYATDPLKIPEDGIEKMAMLKGESDEIVEIDYMVVYTAAAKEWASTRGGIDSLIAQGMRLSQLALDNSNIGITLNLVYAYETEYVETGNSLDDLRRFTFGYAGHTEWADTIRYMTRAREIRDSVGADIMTLVCRFGNAAGLGWQLSQEAGRPQYGTNLVMVHYINQLTKIHEIGHNMGAHHAKDQLVSPGPGLYSFSSGLRFLGNDGKLYSTVMSYTSSSHFPSGGNSTRISHFSDPDIYYRESATGDRLEANNAETMRLTKQTIAAYRARPVPPPPPVDTTPPPPPPPPTIFFPVVNTLPVTDIDFYTAMAHMEIVDNGNDSIIDFGVFVDTWDPTIESKKFPGNPVVISGLEHDTEYFVRGYAENSAGIGLGNAESFTTVAFPTRQIISSPPFTITINSSNKRVQIHNRSWFVYQFSDMQGNVILKRINIGRVANVKLESGTFRLDLSDRWLIPTFTQTHFFTIY